MLLKDTTPPLSRVKHFTTALTEHLLTRYRMHILFEHLMLPQEWKFCLIEKNKKKDDKYLIFFSVSNFIHLTFNH